MFKKIAKSRIVKGVNKSSVLNQYLITIIINIMAISGGITIGWISPNILYLKSEDTHLDAPITEEEISWIGSIHLLTAMIGVFLFWYLLNRFGRKLAACSISVPIVIHWIFLIFGTKSVYVIIARIFSGIGIGGVFSVLPVYVAEIAEDKIRGRLVSSVTLSSYSGFVISYVLCPRVSFHTVAYIMLAPPIVGLVAAIVLAPETPHFLLKKNNIEEAGKTLRWLRGRNVDEELEKLKKSTDVETPNVNFKDFLSAVTLRGLGIGITVLIIQQLSIVFALISYIGKVFEESGSTLSPNDSTVVAGCLLSFGALLSSCLIEHIGRKGLLIGSSLSVCVCLTTLGTYTYLKSIGCNVNSFTWIPILALSLCFFSFSCGLGPIPLVIVTELFSPKIRGAAAQICVFMFWLSAFLIVKFFNTIVDNLELHCCFWLFGSTMIAGAIFIFIFLPETKGRSMEDIMVDLAGGKKLHNVII